LYALIIIIPWFICLLWNKWEILIKLRAYKDIVSLGAGHYLLMSSLYWCSIYLADWYLLIGISIDVFMQCYIEPTFNHSPHIICQTKYQRLPRLLHAVQLQLASHHQPVAFSSSFISLSKNCKIRLLLYVMYDNP
jgi:hypothetical protein